MNPQAAQTYLRTRVLTATPEQLQMMLYDGAIRYTEQAKVSLDKKDWEGVYTNCSRAQKIISELTGGLRHEVAPELCSKLASLYNFIYRKLIEACTRHTVSSLDECLELLRFQRETWGLLLERLGKQKAAVAAVNMDIPAPSAKMEAMLSVCG